MLNVGMSEGASSSIIDGQKVPSIIATKPIKNVAGRTSKETILKQITDLYELSIKDLKERYRDLFPDSNPPSNKDFLIRRIAFKLQEDAFGPLSEPARQQLNALKTELDPLKTLGQRRNQNGESKPSRRVPIPGTIITKMYKGQALQVRVLQKGFEYDGRPYRSLTSLARKISGVPQSGESGIRGQYTN